MRTAILAALLILVAGFGIWNEFFKPLSPWEKKAQLETPDRMQAISIAPVQIPDWPPEVGKPFPEVALFDHTGAPFSLSQLRGKPALIEIVAMSCAGCEAYSGGATYGGFQGFAVQEGLRSIDQYARQISGVSVFDSRLSFVQIIIYNLSLEPPRPEELALWREHFHLDEHSNTAVVSGGEKLANRASFNMIPGFILLDKQGVVRYDATGHSPRHDPYDELLPALPKFL